MKFKIFFLVISSLFVLLACKKDKLNEPVSINRSLDFVDSSESNPKNSIYQALLDKYVQQGLPGLVLLVKTPNEGLWIGASGYARIEDMTPMNKSNILYSGSVGKTYCAVAIMLLNEEGKLSLNDKINKYLSADICNNIPNGNIATIRNLLGHTSGMPNGDHEVQFVADYLNDPFSMKTDKFIKYIYGVKPLFKPGEGYQYSSTGYELLAKIIDKVTGENHSKYYSSHIIQKLDLKNTYYKNEAGYPTPLGLVNCYFDRLGDGKIENVSDINNYIAKELTGSDGIMASIYDFYLFINALMKGNLVSSQSFNQMIEWHDTYRDTKEDKYGLGLMRQETKYGFKIGHSGGMHGAAISVFQFPDNDVSIIVAMNLGTFLDTDLSLKFYDIQDELLDAVFK